MNNESTKFLAGYAATFAALMAVVISATGSGSYAPDSVNFYTLPKDHVVPLNGLSDRQMIAIKRDFIDQHPPPRVALFGNHLVQAMDADSFAPGADSSAFFNFHFQHASLEDVYVFVSYLERRGKLPTEAILVGITHPMVANGDHYLGLQGHLPLDIKAPTFSGNFYARLEDKWTSLVAEAKNRTDWRNVAYRFEVCEHQIAHIDDVEANLRRRSSDDMVDAVASTYPLLDRLRRLPAIGSLVSGGLHAAVAYLGRKCVNTPVSFKSDGSIFGSPKHYPDYLYTISEAFPEPMIHRGDERRIADLLEKIAEIGARNGRKIIFFVHPLYENSTPRLAAEILTNALKLVPELSVFDDRGLRSNPDLFDDPGHPGPGYFRVLMREIREKGILE